MFQEKKPLGKESRNGYVPTQPHHGPAMIYSDSNIKTNSQRFSQSSHSRYSQLSNGYSGGGSIYYPGQRHPDMLPDDEAL